MPLKIPLLTDSEVNLQSAFYVWELGGLLVGAPCSVDINTQIWVVVNCFVEDENSSVCLTWLNDVVDAQLICSWGKWWRLLTLVLSLSNPHACCLWSISWSRSVTRLVYIGIWYLHSLSVCVSVCFKSYGLHHKKQRQTELLTYVDYVELSGPAHLAGLRPGSSYISSRLFVCLIHAQYSVCLSVCHFAALSIKWNLCSVCIRPV